MAYPSPMSKGHLIVDPTLSLRCTTLGSPIAIRPITTLLLNTTQKLGRSFPYSQFASSHLDTGELFRDKIGPCFGIVSQDSVHGAIHGGVNHLAGRVFVKPGHRFRRSPHKRNGGGEIRHK